jgi:DNA primase
VFQDHHISLSGIYAPKKDSEEQPIPASLTRFFESHPETRNAVIHFDNDAPGRLAAGALISSLSAKGINAVDAPPGMEKDVNEDLKRERKEAEKER